MSPSADEVLTFKAASLARAAPNSWREFLDAFAIYVNASQKECVEAPLAVLPVAQGRARQCLKLASLFADAVATADRISERRG